MSAISAVTNTASNNSAEVDANTSNVVTLQGRATALESGVDTLNAEVAALETTVDDPSTGVNALNTKTTTLETTVDDPSTGVIALNTKATALETTVNDPSTGVPALNSNLTALQSTVNTIDSDITTLQTTVNGLGSGVILEELSVTPVVFKTDATGQASPGTVDTAAGNIALTSLVSREPTSLVTTLAKLTAIHTISPDATGAAVMTDINGTSISNYLPPASTKRLRIQYDYQIGWNANNTALFGAVIMASYSGGTFYPILTSIRGNGEVGSFRMESVRNMAVLEHTSVQTGTSEADINAGKIKLTNLAATEYWSFKLHGCVYDHGSFGSVDVYDANNLDQNGTMFPSDYLPSTSSGAQVLAAPLITITAT